MHVHNSTVTARTANRALAAALRAESVAPSGPAWQLAKVHMANGASAELAALRVKVVIAKARARHAQEHLARVDALVNPTWDVSELG
jgi:hypothetical protein